jgi:hypothetical protein
MPYRSEIEPRLRSWSVSLQTACIAKTIEVDASRLSLITHPQEITDLILSAAGRRG